MTTTHFELPKVSALQVERGGMVAFILTSRAPRFAEAGIKVLQVCNLAEIVQDQLGGIALLGRFDSVSALL